MKQPGFQQECEKNWKTKNRPDIKEARNKKKERKRLSCWESFSLGIIRDENGKVRGDFDTVLNPKPYTPYPIFYTSTPGGTGPILIAKIFENFYALN